MTVWKQNNYNNMLHFVFFLEMFKSEWQKNNFYFILLYFLFEPRVTEGEPVRCPVWKVEGPIPAGNRWRYKISRKKNRNKFFLKTYKNTAVTLFPSVWPSASNL